LEIASAMRSVICASRASDRSGIGSGPVEMAKIAPHVPPSTMIGAPIAERKPASRATVATVPDSEP
jgi:hypothetical protein